VSYELKKAKRLLIVSNLFPPHIVGGAEIVAARQCNDLANLGYDVAVFSGRFADENNVPGSLSREVIGALLVYRVTLISLDVESNFYRPEFERRFKSVLGSFRPEVVHFHNVSGLGANLIPVAKSFGAKVVVTLHDHWGFCFKNTRLRNDSSVCENFEECSLCLPRIDVNDGLSVPIRLRRDYVGMCLNHADTIISPSPYLAEAYNSSGMMLRRVQILSNGINLDELKGEVDKFSGPVTFSCFSYLGKHKGIPILLDAAERLAAIPDLRGKWSLTIAGHGELATLVQPNVLRNRFGDAVKYIGRLSHSEVRKQLAKTQVVILPSIWPENEPVTMLEAIATGTAQLASYIGGNVSLVDDEKSGLFFSPGDTVGLLTAMEKFVRNPQLAREHGQYNTTRRDQFSDRITIDKLQKIYDAETSSSIDDDILVICAGTPPGAALDILFDHFHLVETPGRRIRFIWHAWADGKIWGVTSLVWFWGELSATECALATQAMRYGIPILAQKSLMIGAIAEKIGNLGVYGDLLEALGLLSALATSAQYRLDLKLRDADAASLVSQLLSQASFHLSAGAIG
jgi:glycosyltransferase involved in cell wall biosynthesis